MEKIEKPINYKIKSFRQIYYHIVFGTKFRKPTIPDNHCEELYKYIWGFINNKKCKLYRINGSSDHLHLLVDIHPSFSVSDFVKEIKVSTSIWMKTQKIFPNFEGWAEGYACFTISHNDKENVIEYIKNQKEHHKIKSFNEEYKCLLHDFGILINDEEIE